MSKRPKWKTCLGLMVMLALLSIITSMWVNRYRQLVRHEEDTQVIRAELDACLSNKNTK